LAATFKSRTIRRGRIDAFPSEHWLSERAGLALYRYVCLVNFYVGRLYLWDWSDFNPKTLVQAKDHSC